MRIFMMLLFLIGSLFSSVSLLAQEDLSCCILERMFQEKIFYELPSLNLSYVDTLTVLDRSNFFEDCNEIVNIAVDTNVLNPPRFYDSLEVKSVINKVIVIKNRDLLPFPLINGAWQEDYKLKGKYEDYFIMERSERIGNLILITLFRLRSNHKIFIAYKIDNEKLMLIDSQVGQY